MELTRIDWPRILFDLRHAKMRHVAVARELNVSPSNLYNWLNGSEPPWSMGDALLRLHRQHCPQDKTS